MSIEVTILKNMLKTSLSIAHSNSYSNNNNHHHHHHHLHHHQHLIVYRLKYLVTWICNNF